MKKRLLSTLLVCCTVLTLIPCTVWATEVASGICGENLTWELSEEGTLVISGSGDMWEWKDASSLTPVFSRPPWYDKNIERVVIGDDVTSIGARAFLDCSSITSIAIPDKLITIGEFAFCNCAKLTSIAIPGSITNIGYAPFSRCQSLNTINVATSNSAYSSIDGVLFNKKQTELISFPSGRKEYNIPSSVTSIGDGAFDNCDGLTNIIIPSSVTRIGESAFRSCSSLTNISIPDTVTRVEYGAFYNCNHLTSITIPSSVTSVGNIAFDGCDKLTDVYYSGSEDQWNKIQIGSYNSPLYNATIHYNSTGPDQPIIPDPPIPPSTEITLRPDSDTITVGAEILISAGIPNSSGLQASDITWSSSDETIATVTADGFSDFTSTAIATINGISPGTATITVALSDGRSASCEIIVREPFTGTCGDNLTWALTDGTLTISGTGAMETFKLSDTGNKTSAPWYDYRNEITKVVLEDGVTNISANAFRNHPNLVNINIPASVASIGNYAFYLCAGVSIHFAGDAPRFDVPAFEGLSRATIYYPAENNTWTKDIRHNYHRILWQPTGLDSGNRITMLEDTWNFANLTSDIPLYCYSDLFGLAEAYYLWGIAKLSGGNGTNGHCFGMVATAINSLYETPPITSFGANKLFDVSPENQCAASKLQTAEDFINYGQVYQYSLAIQVEMLSNKNDLQKLYQAIINYENGGAPVSISIKNDHGGHQVLALSVKNYDEYSIISVYDCNYPNEVRPIYTSQEECLQTGNFNFSVEKYGSLIAITRFPIIQRV